MVSEKFKLKFSRKLRTFFFDASEGHESFSRGREGRERVVQHEAAPVLTEDDGDRITEFLKWN